MSSIVLSKPKLSVKAQTLATIISIISAVALPQFFHAMGAVSGLGTSLGETFLPMHLPIILSGLVAGPYVGAIAGFFSPLISFSLSGMPSAMMLPFMMIELLVYGLAAGVLRNVKLPTVLKVLAVQIAGRLIRAAAIVFSVYALGNESVRIAVIWKSIPVGIFGIVLQLVLIPLIVYRVENMKRSE